MLSFSRKKMIINRQVSYELSTTVSIHNVSNNHDIVDNFQWGFSDMCHNCLARLELGRQKYEIIFNKRLISIHKILPGHCYLKWQVLLQICVQRCQFINVNQFVTMGLELEFFSFSIQLVSNDRSRWFVANHLDSIRKP